jgi:hypothetical protein
MLHQELAQFALHVGARCRQGAASVRPIVEHPATFRLPLGRARIPTLAVGPASPRVAARRANQQSGHPLHAAGGAGHVRGEHLAHDGLIGVAERAYADWWPAADAAVAIIPPVAGEQLELPT